MIQLSNSKRTIITIILLIGSFVTVLNQTLLATAFPELMNKFNVSFDTVQWLTTGFLLANAMMVPVSAFLIKRIPTKWLYTVSLIIFLVGTLLAYLTPTNAFWMLLLARIMQALAAGISLPVLMVVLFRIFPANRRGAAMGLSGLVVGLAPALGPSIAGWILTKNHSLHILGFTLSLPASWQTLFSFLLPLAIIAMILSLIFMENVLPTEKVKLDWISLFVSSIGLGTFLYGFSSISSKGWHNLTVLMTIAVGIIFITYFVWRQLHLEKPFLNMSLLKNKTFSLAICVIMITMMSMIGVEMIIPTYLQQIQHLSPLNSGLALLPGALMLGIITMISGSIADKQGVRKLAIFGMSLLALSSVPFIFINESTPIINIIVFYAIRMFGISMVIMNMNTLALSSIDHKSTSDGTALVNTGQTLSGSVGLTLLVTIMSNVITNNMPETTLKLVNPLVYGQKAIDATLSGYHATFVVATLLAIIAVIFAFLLPKKMPDVKKDED